MKVLLSIKPEFAERIFDGSKKYEFRRAIFKNPDIKTVIVYASSPVQRVIGEFDIETVLCDSPQKLWRKTSKDSGISKEFFFDYFSERDIGFAIQVKKVRRFKISRCLRSSYDVSPPQSFCYV
jgi:predicted transcriptional regulator